MHALLLWYFQYGLGLHALISQAKPRKVLLPATLPNKLHRQKTVITRPPPLNNHSRLDAARPVVKNGLNRLICARSKHLSSRVKDVWELALNESGLDLVKLSRFACSVPKIPQSWVQRIQAVNHTKHHTFNFAGSYHTKHKKKEFVTRDWVMLFARDNFTNNDSLKITNVGPEYIPLGVFDISKESKGYIPNEHTTKQTVLDMDYFATMAASNFTLTPAGSRAWSMRFYEAIFAGSIPVVSSETEKSDPRWGALWRIPYRYIVLDSGAPLQFRQDVVDENLRLAIRYQTLIQGDNEPSTVQV